MAAASEDRDLELIGAAQRGERSAFENLLHRHNRWVRGIVYATLGSNTATDDVLQQVWTQVWQQIGTLTDAQKWRGWVYRLARNAAIDAGQDAARRRRLLRTVAADERTGGIGHAGPFVRAVVRERQQQVLDAIQSLPAIYREPFILRHLEEWNYSQIGQTLGLPVDTVETRLVRARRLLREMLAGDDAASA